MVNFSCKPSILVFKTTTTRLPCGMYIIYSPNCSCVNNVLARSHHRSIIKPRDNNRKKRLVWLFTEHNDSHMITCNVSTIRKFLHMLDVYSPNWTYVNNVLTRNNHKSILNPRDNNQKERLAWLFKEPILTSPNVHHKEIFPYVMSSQGRKFYSFNAITQKEISPYVLSSEVT